MTCTVPPINLRVIPLKYLFGFCKHSFVFRLELPFSEATDLSAVNTCDMKLFHHSDDDN